MSYMSDYNVTKLQHIITHNTPVKVCFAYDFPCKIPQLISSVLAKTRGEASTRPHTHLDCGGVLLDWFQSTRLSITLLL